MPLSDHEQRILEEIERRLAEEDPKLDEQVGRTDLYSHLARRIRLASLAFVVGLVLLLLFVLNAWIGAIGFVVMVLSALLIYRYLGSSDGTRFARCSQGRLSIAGILGPDRGTLPHDLRLRARTDRRRQASRVARSGSSAPIVTSWLAASSRAGVQRWPFPGRVTVDRRFYPSSAGRRRQRVKIRTRSRKGARPHGGIHYSPSLQVHRLHPTATPILGSDRSGPTHRPGNRRAPRRAASLRVPRSGSAAGGEVAARRRMSLQRVRRSWEFLNKKAGLDRHLSEVRLVTDGQSIFKICRRDGEVMDALRDGQMAFFVAIDDIASGVHTNVTQFREDREKFLRALREAAAHTATGT